MARTIIAGASLRVEPGERIGLTGPNGSRKSTLLKVLAGHLRLSEGQLTNDGVPVWIGLYQFTSTSG